LYVNSDRTARTNRTEALSTVGHYLPNITNPGNCISKQPIIAELTIKYVTYLSSINATVSFETSGTV